MNQSTYTPYRGINHATDDGDLDLTDDLDDQDMQDKEEKGGKQKKSGVVSVLSTLFLIAFLSPLGFLWWSTIGYESPWSQLETRDAGKVLEVSYLHGLGTRTLIKTADDLILLDQAVRMPIGTEVVSQRNAFAERLCIKGKDRCWYVVNR